MLRVNAIIKGNLMKLLLFTTLSVFVFAAMAGKPNNQHQRHKKGISIDVFTSTVDDILVKSNPGMDCLYPEADSYRSYIRHIRKSGEMSALDVLKMFIDMFAEALDSSKTSIIKKRNRKDDKVVTLSRDWKAKGQLYIARTEDEQIYSIEFYEKEEFDKHTKEPISGVKELFRLPGQKESKKAKYVKWLDCKLAN